MSAFFRSVLDNCTKDAFIRELMRQYHYEPETFESVKKVITRMKNCIGKEALWEHQIYRNEEGIPLSKVVITLGKGVDFLQEAYLDMEQLSEAYMVETIASRLLLSAYQEYNRWVKEHTIYTVKRYHFIGDATHPMEELPKLLEALKVPVTCNQAYCMQPKKSVAFYAELTEDKQVECAGICVGCDRIDCENKMTQPKEQVHFADMTDRPLPYGYQRILGGKS